MINLNQHIYRCGPNEKCDLSNDDLKDTNKFRKHIEPWLTAVFQSEHLSLLVGSGFTSGVAVASGGRAANMAKCEWACDLKEKVNDHAEQSLKSADGGRRTSRIRFVPRCSCRPVSRSGYRGRVLIY